MNTTQDKCLFALAFILGAIASAALISWVICAGAPISR